MKTGSTGTACIGSAAPSATRRLRNHVKKIIGKPCAGKPHARIERGQRKRAHTGTAPLTTNGVLRCSIHCSYRAGRATLLRAARTPLEPLLALERRPDRAGQMR